LVSPDTETLLTETTCSGLSIGKGRSKTVLTKLKIAVFAPIPSASVITAMALKPGRLSNIREA